MQITPEDLAQMRGGLSFLHQGLRTFIRDAGYRARPGSKAEADLNSFPDRERVHTVHCMVPMLNEAAADHLTAFIKTISDPPESIAPWTCVRAILESSALASWLFSPDIDVRQRVARGLAHRYEGLIQQQRFSAAANLKPHEVGNRINDVERDALRLGYEPVLDKHGKRIGIAMQMPSTTSLVKEIHDNEDFYRLLSAVAHGHFWAIKGLSFKVDPSRTVEPANDGVQLKVLEKVLSLNGMAMLCLTSAQACARPFWSQCLYFDWDRNALKEIFEKSFDQLLAADNQRFWRHN